MSIDQHPEFGIVLTLAVYYFSIYIKTKFARFQPLFFTSVTIILLLSLTRIPYQNYAKGGDMITFFLGPATVALGVPLYKQFTHIKKNIGAILSGITVGAVSGIASAGFLVWVLHGSEQVLLSMMPKSVTAPISIEIVRQLGGPPELGAVFTVMTGLLGSIIGPEFLQKLGIRQDIPVGVAMGTSSHGIGTARLILESELRGSVSGFAMGMNGIITSIIMIPLYYWF